MMNFDKNFGTVNNIPSSANTEKRRKIVDTLYKRGCYVPVKVKYNGDGATTIYSGGARTEYMQHVEFERADVMEVSFHNGCLIAMVAYCTKDDNGNRSRKTEIHELKSSPIGYMSSRRIADKEHEIASYVLSHSIFR